MTRLVPALLMTVAATAAAAGGTYDMAATGQGMTEREVFPIADGFMAASLKSTMQTSNLGDGHPFSGMDGHCSGHLVVRVPAASGSGVCHYVNAAGDTAVIQYVVHGLTQDGGMHGAWLALGGTGAMSGVQGGGSWINSAVSDAGAFDQSVSGAITLP
ncbi:hypothetical protein KUH32_08555 [Thalassococcus sp. CAU 1522]|uniref:Uncharacterized protein n=1 Tax=Thalassococcus arenae TaxID=2851652 RepID=A0ABS6N822_9RHOB|nr:hypothetical protein [Thalassococcus arenae]MBV2359822.1 hypothetical protein [Thalassococcus arenae]